MYFDRNVIGRVTTVLLISVIFLCINAYAGAGLETTIMRDDTLKSIFILDDTRYHILPGQHADPTANRDFYMNIIYDCGVDTTDQVEWFYNDLYHYDSLSLDELIKYEMLLVIDDDWLDILYNWEAGLFSSYLDIGGKIMITGRDCLRGWRTPPLQRLEAIFGEYPGRYGISLFARDYLNLYGNVYPGWHPFEGPDLNLTQEMIGAYSAHPDFSDIEFDTIKVKQIVHGFYDTLEIYLPAVNRIIRQNESTTLFTFESFKPQISDFDGWPVAVRYAPIEHNGDVDDTLYYSSYFAFPLYFIKYDQAVDLMKTMMEWYGIIKSETNGDDENEEKSELPFYFRLSQNYPNPFNAETTIDYSIKVSGNIDISVYNIMGEKIQTLVNSYSQPGDYSITWDASGFSSGIYFYKLTTIDESNAKRMTLLK